MSLAMVGVNASYEFRWRRWALLRDTVATHLENTESGSRFPHFATIGQALGSGSVRIPAAPLASELQALSRSKRSPKACRRIPAWWSWCRAG